MTGAPGTTVRCLLASHALSAAATTLTVPLVVREVYQATASNGALSLLGAARMLPFVALGALGGRLVDRSQRVALLALSALVRAALAAGIALTAVLHGPVTLLVVLAVACSVAALPAYPAAGAAIGCLTGGRERELVMGRLVAVESGAWVAGPALGGVLIAVSPCWTAPAAAALAALAAAVLVARLQLPRAAPGPGPVGEPSVWAMLFGAPAVVAAVVLANVAIDGTAAVLVLLSGGSQGYGLQVAVLGAGAALALAAARLTRVRHLPGYLATAALALAGAGLVGWAPGRAVLLLVAGAAAIAVEAAATSTALQHHVPAHRHGEALGALDQVILGGALLGATTAPLAAAGLGAALTITAAGVLLLPLASLLTPRHRHPLPDPVPGHLTAPQPADRVPALYP